MKHLLKDLVRFVVRGAVGGVLGGAVWWLFFCMFSVGRLPGLLLIFYPPVLVRLVLAGALGGLVLWLLMRRITVPLLPILRAAIGTGVVFVMLVGVVIYALASNLTQLTIVQALGLIFTWSVTVGAIAGLTSPAQSGKQNDEGRETLTGAITNLNEDLAHQVYGRVK